MSKGSFSRILLLTFAALAAAGPAFAHAKLQSSKPGDREVLARSPERIELEFSVGVQPGMSSIILKEADGREVDLTAPESSADRKRVWVITPDLTPGDYKVLWRALSADDHMISGEFSFQVGPAAMENDPEPAAPSAEHDHNSMDHTSPPKIESVNWPQSVIRWLMYAAMMLITGGLFFRFFVVGRLEHEPSSVREFDRWSGTLFIITTIALAATLLASLALQTFAVFESIEPQNVYSVIVETTFGAPWILQLAGTLALVVLLLKGREKSESSWAFRAALGVSLIVLLGPGLSGHARAAAAEYSLAVPLAWLHLVAASVWIGGLVMIVFGLPKLLLRVDRRYHSDVLAEVIQRFNTLAIPATVVLALTGIYNSWIHVESFAALTGTIYGKVLLTKVAVTLLMIVLGGMNAFVLRPRIAATSDGQTFFRSVRLEILLAAIVLLLAAVLAFLPPARGHDPTARVAVRDEQTS